MPNTQFKLNTGAEIPGMGFGTWQDEKAQEDAVVEAIKVGYRHIDTAVMLVFGSLVSPHANAPADTGQRNM